MSDLVVSVGVGLSLGLAAGISPGPLLALVVSTSLRRGAAAGVAVAAAPLTSDAIIVATTLLALQALPAGTITWIGVVGGLFVAGLGLATLREARTAVVLTPEPSDSATGTVAGTGTATGAGTATDTGAGTATGTGSGITTGGSATGIGAALRTGSLVNLLSPHPWLTWMAALGPLVVNTWHNSPGGAIALVTGFYVTLVGSKAALAVLVSRARGRLTDRGYRYAVGGCGVLLVVFGLIMLWQFGGTLGRP